MSEVVALLRPAVWKVALWSSIGIGYLYGTFKQIYFDHVIKPAFLLEEERRRERVISTRLDHKNKEISDLQKRLEIYEPPLRLVEAEEVKRFHFSDLESDDLLDRWINFINEGSEIQTEDTLFADTTFTEKK